MTTRYFGVDIGNSGLRVSELLPAVERLGESMRLNWLHDPAQHTVAQHTVAQHTVAQHDKSRRNRAPRKETPLSSAPHQNGSLFTPDDPAWTDKVDQFVRLHTPEGGLCCWLVSSVRRDAEAVLRSFVQRLPHPQLYLPVDWRHIPLKFSVEFPQQVGIDRLLAALAACRISRQRPMLVVQAGSAVTVDLVRNDVPAQELTSLEPSMGTSSSNLNDQSLFAQALLSRFSVSSDRCSDQGALLKQRGDRNATQPVQNDSTPDASTEGDVFCGGAILPGVPMILRLLGKGADLLPELIADDLTDLPPLPGRNTQSAMLCGAASSLVGGTMHLVRRYREDFGLSVPVIISGGDGMRLAPYLDQPTIVVPHLVQQGLLALAMTLAANQENRIQ
ncbi:MAG: type III pantothenate kinase [Planctomycetales bacterium]|nr:type III pantothenate kinase [Planctomycetales bacterium]MCA9184692.1 type III pantothenate kinase [Planctomycetales bacterium]